MHGKAKDSPPIPPLVITAHGILTHGDWQRTFAAVMSGSPTIVESYNYGKYGLFRFLTPGFNQRKIDEFHTEYSKIVRSCPQVNLSRYDQRPCLAAHSFGTWIACKAMEKYDDIRFDKLILCGSILPRDFEWARLFARDQVALVRNERGHKDPWPGWADKLVPGTGTSGADGFDWFEAIVEDSVYDEFGHSDFLGRPHMEKHWVPFLRRPPSPLTLLHGSRIKDGREFSKNLDYTGTVIDVEAYGGLTNYKEVEIRRGLSLEWIKINADIYTFLIDRESRKPAGYINAMPVDDGLYAGIRAGTITDNQVPASGIVAYDRDQEVKIYLMSIAVAERYRQWGQGLWNQGYAQLVSGFLDKLVHYAKHRSIRATHFLATAWTDPGRQMCKSLAMVEIGHDRFGDEVYEVELAKVPPDKKGIMPALRHLLQTYRDLGK